MRTAATRGPPISCTTSAMALSGMPVWCQADANSAGKACADARAANRATTATPHHDLRQLLCIDTLSVSRYDLGELKIPGAQKHTQTQLKIAG